MTETLQSHMLGSAGPEGSVHRVTEKKRILIVENDGFTRLVLIFLFRVAGFGVDFTSNGTLALGKLRNSPPDALLLELKLPVVSGLELIRKARREPKFGDRPIYLFTNTEQMSRAAHKEVQKSVTRVFDKGTTTMEDLLNSVIAEFSEVAAEASSSASKPDEVAAPEPVANSIVPGNLDQIIGGVQEQYDRWVNSTTPAESAKCSDKLLSRVRYVLSCAQAAGLRNLGRQAKALEAYLNELFKDQGTCRKEDLETIGQAVEVLGSLSDGKAKKPRQFTVGVVDESNLSGSVLSIALLKAGINPVSFENPAQALAHLESNPVDLIIANLTVPELHGFDSAQIRKFPQLAATPIIFVSEPIAKNDKDWGEPAAAPLNANSRLLTGLVMKTLNELQSGDGQRALPRPASPAPLPLGQEEATPDLLGNVPTDVEEATISPPLKPWGQLLEARPVTTPVFEPVSELPEAELPEVEPANLDANGADAPAGPATILLVEDDPFVLKVYSQVLERAGFFVEAAQDGLVAFESLPRLRPSLVVLDLMLPQVDGLEVLQFVRADSDLKDTPVIVLSNAYVGQLAARATEAGANCGLSKTDCTPARLAQQACELLGRPVPEDLLEAGLDGAGVEAGAGDGTTSETSKGLTKIRCLCLSCARAAASERNSAYLSELYRRVRFLTAHAALLGFTKLADVSSVLEGLLFELIFNQAQATSSTFQTIAKAVDFLNQLAEDNDTTLAEPRPEPRVLVVDSDAVGNVATVAGLQRGHFQVVGTQDPAEGIRMLDAGGFDAVTLDVNLPGMGGFEVCQQLRRAPQHHELRVLFFSADIESEDRARSVVSGGDDLLPKSISPLELVLRLMMHTLKPAGQGFETGAGLESVAPASDSEGGWLVAEDTQAEPVAEQFEPAAAISPDSTAAPAAAPSLLGEPVPGSETEQTPQAQEEAMARLAMDSATERATDEPYGALQQGPIPISETPDERVLEPAPEAKETENEWLADPAGVSAEPAAPLQCDAKNVMNQDQTMSAFDTKFPAGLRLQPEAISAQSDERNSPGLPVPPPPRSGLAQKIDALQAECTKQRELMARYSEERESLLERIFNAENEARRQEVILERKDEMLAELQAQLDASGATPESADAARRVQELEEQLNQRAAELDQARAEAGKQAAERGQAETDLRQQLEASGLAAEQNGAAHQQAQARCDQLEQELADLRQAREGLNTQLAKEQQDHAGSAKRIKELEGQLQSGKDQTADLEQGMSQRVAALARVTADLAKERGARHRIEERAAALNQRLQELHNESRLLLESQRADRERIAELEGRLRESEEAFVRQAAELEHEKVDCRLAEEQLDKTSDLNAHLHKHLSTFDVAHKTLNSTQQDLQTRLDGALHSLQENGAKLQHESAERERLATELEHARRELQTQGRKQDTVGSELEATLQALREGESKLQQETAERQRLAAALEAAERELQNHGRTHETLESDLKTTSEALRESESKLQQETAERRRLAQAFESAQLEHHDHSERAGLELSKARSALQFEQVERERLEAQMASLRHASLDAARGNRLQRNAWRKQLNGPVDKLYQSANDLLQLEMSEEQKKLAEMILQDVLLVQNRLEEPETPGAEAGEHAGPAGRDISQ